MSLDWVLGPLDLPPPSLVTDYFPTWSASGSIRFVKSNQQRWHHQENNVRDSVDKLRDVGNEHVVVLAPVDG